MRTLNDLSPSEFENLSLDILSRLGLKNSVWRTPGRDGGRDIQGDEYIDDFSGHASHKSWYVDCKRYSGTVSWPTVWEKIAFADSNHADVFLLITSSTLSPQAIDEVNRWNNSRRTPSVRFWNGHDLDHRLRLHPDIQVKYGLSPQPIKDSALGIIKLSKVLLNYTNNIAAQKEFGKFTDRFLVAIQAQSELITARLSEIENYGRIIVQPFRNKIDTYEWLENTENFSFPGFDRFVLRAIFSLVWCYSKTEEMKLKTDNQLNMIKLYGSNLPATLLDDLEVLGFWGSIKVNLTSEMVILEKINATN